MAKLEPDVIDATIYVLVDDKGQVTAGEDSDANLWRCHEGKGGYSSLQLYELTLTLPRPGGCIEIAATVPAGIPPSTQVHIAVARADAQHGTSTTVEGEPK